MRSETAVEYLQGHGYGLGLYAKIRDERGPQEAEAFRQSRPDDVDLQRQAALVDDTRQPLSRVAASLPAAPHSDSQ